MHDFLHVEHLLLDLPSDFKYCVNIVNICTNYLENSLCDFSEIIPQNSEKCISAHRNFQNFPGEHAPGPPPLEGERASPRRDRYAITSFGVLEFHAPPPPPPRDSNPGSATAVFPSRPCAHQTTCRRRTAMPCVTKQISGWPLSRSRSMWAKQLDVESTHLLSGGVFSGRFVKSKMPFKAVSRTSLSKQTLTKFGRYVVGDTRLFPVSDLFFSFW